MSWFYMMWTVCGLCFITSLYLIIKALHKVANINTVRINENKKRLEEFAKRVYGADSDES